MRSFPLAKFYVLVSYSCNPKHHPTHSRPLELSQPKELKSPTEQQLTCTSSNHPTLPTPSYSLEDLGMNKVQQNLPFYDWLIALGKTSSMFIHDVAVTRSSLLKLSKYLILCRQHILFIHPLRLLISLLGYCEQCCKEYRHANISLRCIFPVDNCSVVGLLDNVVIPLGIFCKNHRMVSTSVVPSYISTNSTKGSNFSTSSPITISNFFF